MQKSALSVRNGIVAILAFIQSGMFLLWTQVLILLLTCAVLYVLFLFLEMMYFGICMCEEGLEWLLEAQELLKGLNKYNFSVSCLSCFSDGTCLALSLSYPW